METPDRVVAERAEAFELLAQIVQKNYAVGRRSYAASVKPQLVKETYEGFSEARLQFASFRKFLEAACDEGFVELHRAASGPDLEITPPGELPLGASQRRGTAPVRKDFWDAFLNWGEDWARAYDVGSGRAIRFPAKPAPLEKPEYTLARQRVEQEPEQLVAIPFVSFEEQLTWMKSFVSEVEDRDVRDALQTASSSEKPFRAFRLALESHPSVRLEWSRWRQRLVEERIIAWADENSLKVELRDPAAVGGDEDTHGRAGRSDQSHPDRMVALRELLHGAIDRMPESELLQVKLPAVYFVRD